VTLRRLVIAAVCGTAAVLAAAALGLHGALAPAAAVAEPQILTVPRGASLQAITRQLAAAGLIRNARAVELLARYRGIEGKLRAGEYRLSAAAPPGAILDTLARGDVVTYELVVPEGYTAAMIADRIAAAGLGDGDAFLAWVRDPQSATALGVPGDGLEGYLYPETYHLPHGLSARQLAAVLVKQFLTVWHELEPSARDHSLSMHEIVTLASIVEKETAVAEERPLIAAVFLNRLARGMRLETDPAVIYGIPGFDGNLRRRDLENPDNPFNTYRIAGLPPGPIANPGRGAFAAVLSPAETDYLYFVSRNDGTHKFSRTYREHLLAVNEFQKTRSR